MRSRRNVVHPYFHVVVVHSSRMVSGNSRITMLRYHSWWDLWESWRLESEVRCRLDCLLPSTVYLVQVSWSIKHFIVRTLVIEQHLVLRLVERQSKSRSFGQCLVEGQTHLACFIKPNQVGWIFKGLLSLEWMLMREQELVHLQQRLLIVDE